ncbi:MAG: hypothetical protein ACQER7_08190, partial [Bacteroidota bacterium]
MMTSKRLISCILFFLLLLSFSSYAQLYDFEGSADAHRSTGYGEDTIFVFFSGNENKVVAAAHSTDDTSDFHWKRFNRNTLEFDSLFVHKDTTLSKIRLDSLFSRGALHRSTEGL